MVFACARNLAPNEPRGYSPALFARSFISSARCTWRRVRAPPRQRAAAGRGPNVADQLLPGPEGTRLSVEAEFCIYRHVARDLLRKQELNWLRSGARNAPGRFATGTPLTQHCRPRNTERPGVRLVHYCECALQGSKRTCQRQTGLV